MCGGGKEIGNSRLESCNPRKSRDNIGLHRPIRSVSQTSCQAISPYRENSVLCNRSVPGLPSLVDRSPPAIAHDAPSLRPLRTAEMSDGEKAVRATKRCSRYALRRPEHLRKRRGTAPLFGAFSFYIKDLDICGGAGGIRTLDTLLTYTHFPGERLRPLGHRSACAGRRLPIASQSKRQGVTFTLIHILRFSQGRPYPCLRS